MEETRLLTNFEGHANEREHVLSLRPSEPRQRVTPRPRVDRPIGMCRPLESMVSGERR